MIFHLNSLLFFMLFCLETLRVVFSPLMTQEIFVDQSKKLSYNSNKTNFLQDLPASSPLSLQYPIQIRLTNLNKPCCLLQYITCAPSLAYLVLLVLCVSLSIHIFLLLKIIWFLLFILNRFPPRLRFFSTCPHRKYSRITPKLTSLFCHLHKFARF